MKVFRTIALLINALFPFLYPFKHLFKRLNYFKGIVLFIRDYYKYKKNENESFPLKMINLYPSLFDRFDEAGSISKHYFHQDVWAAKKVYKSSVKEHYDVGSRMDGFISHCLVFTKVVMLDVRPLNHKVLNLNFIQTNAMDMSNVSSNSIQSLSSLHAVEHFGLGRYGDPIDPDGYKKAIKEYIRILKPNGDLYFSVPIGVQRVEFNGHRVFDPAYVIELYSALELIEFSVIDDTDHFQENASFENYQNCNYSCGLFHFRKIR